MDQSKRARQISFQRRMALFLCRMMSGTAKFYRGCLDSSSLHAEPARHQETLYRVKYQPSLNKKNLTKYGVFM